MKNIAIFYTFQKEKENDPNCCMFSHNFNSNDEVKIRHIIQSLPIPILDKPYHFRFKTVCEEAEPKIIAWVDVSNQNAKAPIINNTVSVKILQLSSYGLSKIYTHARLYQIKQLNGQQTKPFEPKNQEQAQKQIPVQKEQQAQQQQKVEQKVEQIFTQQQFIKTPTQQNKIQNSTENKETQQSFYVQQQNVLDNLLDGDDLYSNSQNISQNSSNIQTTSQQYIPTYQQMPSPTKQQQSQPETTTSKKNLNLLGEDDDFVQNQNQYQQQSQNNFQPKSYLSQNQNNTFQTQKAFQQTSEQPINREQLIEQKKQDVQNQVDGKVRELKEMWSSEEEYDKWRAVNKDEIEPKIQKWAFKDNSRNQIRNMLAQLHEILWEGTEWIQCSIADVLTDSGVKNKYREAIRIVHPDKNQERDFKQRYISERVFFELNQAFNNHRKGGR